MNVHVADWHEDGLWLGYRVVDAEGHVAARFALPDWKVDGTPGQTGAWMKAHDVAAGLNAGGVRRERALREAEAKGKAGLVGGADRETHTSGTPPQRGRRRPC